MTVNRRWLLREWLFLLAGLVYGFVINFIPYAAVAWQATANSETHTLAILPIP